MRKAIILLIPLLLIFEAAAASTKNDNRMKVAEKALTDGKYAEAKATFEDLKDNPQYRQKCYLYLAMIYHQNGQLENALAALADFKRYITEKTDVSLMKSAENLNDEIAKNYGTLEIAIFDRGEKAGVDQGFYVLAFRSEGGLNPPQEARLKLINKILSQSQNLYSWKSDGTFLKGKIVGFPVRMYDTAPMTAEVNGVPIYFRFDFQTRQGLWIPYDILDSHDNSEEASYQEEGLEPFTPAENQKKNSASRFFLVGAAAALIAGIAIAFSQ